MADAHGDTRLSAAEAIQSVLFEMKRDLGALRRDVTSLRDDLRRVDRKVDGLTLLLTLLAGQVRHIERRVETLERVKP